MSQCSQLAVLASAPSIHNTCRCEPGAAPLKVAVLLSGGVDSSLALHLLKAAGHNVTAFYLKIWFQDDFENFWSQCPWEEDLQYCQQVGRGTHLAAVGPDQVAKLLVHAKLAATPQCAGDQMQSRCACAPSGIQASSTDRRELALPSRPQQLPV